MEAIKANTPLKREQSRVAATVGWTALVAGGALAAYGMSRRSPRALAFGLAGGVVAPQGAKTGPAASLFKREVRGAGPGANNRAAGEAYEFRGNQERRPPGRGE